MESSSPFAQRLGSPDYAALLAAQVLQPSAATTSRDDFSAALSRANRLGPRYFVAGIAADTKRQFAIRDHLKWSESREGN